MTVDVFPGAPSYTVSGTGPYNIGHEYDREDDIVCVIVDGDTRTTLATPADYSVAPAGPAGDGDVTLTPTAATTHDGLQLIITRATTIEQGWQGNQGAREKSLELQLNRIVMGLQDRAQREGSSIRADREMLPFVPVANTLLGFDANLNPAPVTSALDQALVSVYMASLLLSVDEASLLAAINANLEAFAGLTIAADKLPYGTGPDTLGLADFTSFARGLLALVNQTEFRAAIGASYASQAQAEAGLINTAVMSPLTTKQAIDAHLPMKTLAQKTASNSPTLEFTEMVSGSFRNYLLLVENLVPATDAVDIFLRLSNDAGVSFRAGASDYNYINHLPAGVADGTAAGTSTSTIRAYDGAAPQIALSRGDGSNTRVGSAAGEDGWSGSIWLYGPHDSKKTRVQAHGSYYDENGAVVPVFGAGSVVTAEDNDAVQFVMSSGPIESGTVTLLGFN